jgi:hypothetical protein
MHVPDECDDVGMTETSDPIPTDDQGQPLNPTQAPPMEPPGNPNDAVPQPVPHEPVFQEATETDAESI